MTEARASSLVFQRSPGWNLAQFSLFNILGGPLNKSHSFVVANQHASQLRKWLFQEERGIYSNVPRQYSQPCDMGQPQSPHRASSPPSLPCQHGSHQGLKKKLKFPSAWLAGTFHWLRLFWAPRRRHCSFSLGWEPAHIRTCHQQEGALGVSAQANEWTAIFNVWFLSVFQKAQHLGQSCFLSGLQTTRIRNTWVLWGNTDFGIPPQT